jgi:septal ring factor EnvC (AmiA/AmiB activator)
MYYLYKLCAILLFSIVSTTSSWAQALPDDQLKEIELKISSAAQKKYTYLATITELSTQNQQLQQELTTLQKKIDFLKENITQNIRSEFMLRNKSTLKILLEDNNAKHNLSTLLFFNKLNAYQAKKINDYLALMQQQKSLTKEISSNIAKVTNINSSTQEEINNLKLAYDDRSKILTLKQAQDTQKLSEIKIKNTQKINSPTDEHVNPLLNINPQSINYIQKNRAIIYATEGAKVLAINSGEIVFCGWMRGYGIMIIVDHGENLMSLYGHNQTTFKKSGDKVSKGELISLVGKSGGQVKPGLYFEVRKNGVSTNLSKWLTVTG